MKSWNDIFGTLDLTRFSEAQQLELQRGMDLDLPVQLYANPCFTAEEMANMRNALEATMYSRSEPEKMVVATDHGPEELYLGFRSDSNFQNHPERICYVPENWDFDDGFGYTGRDFISLCNGDVQKAKCLFDMCDWQHPETVIDELKREGSWETLGSSDPVISVKTAMGELVASVKADHDYPGISIDLKGDGLNAQYQENSVGLAWVEFSPEKNNIQTVVYGDGNADEFTHLVEHKNILAMERPKPSLSERIESAIGKSSSPQKESGMPINPER